MAFEEFILLYDKLIEIVSASSVSFLVTNRYLYAISILLISVAIGKLFLFIVERVILAITRKTKTDIDDLIIEKSRGPLFYILILTGVSFSFAIINPEGTSSKIINRIIASLVLLIVAIMVNRVIGVLISNVGKRWAEKTESSMDDELLPLISKASVAIVFTFTLIFILKVWKVDITGLLAGLGIVGIALGLAFQDSLKNIFGGIFLILDKNIKIGDIVKLESGEVGEVMDVGLRSTRIKTPDNEMIIVPNGNLSSSRLQNYVLPDIRLRVNIKFSVAYGTKVDKVEKVVLDAISKLEGRLNEPAPKVSFLEMGESSLNLVCRFWIDDYANAEKARSDANRMIYEALSKAGIEIPFPTRQLYIKREQ